MRLVGIDMSSKRLTFVADYLEEEKDRAMSFFIKHVGEDIDLAEMENMLEDFSDGRLNRNTEVKDGDKPE